METIIKLFVALLLLLVQIVCGYDIPKLLLISFDGFRYDYLEKLPPSETPNFHRIISNGVRAKWMTSVFPTVTYPNHQSLITGLYPESHGIVHNRFYDGKWNEHFWFDHKRDNVDPFWYDNGAEPIYVTNHLAGQGRKSGSLLWPTGIGKVKCIGPDYTIADSDAFTQMNFTVRMDHVIKWFSQSDDPANLALLYINEPDEVGHLYGPESQEIKDMIKELDKTLGHLFKRMEETQLLESLNIILTADHGFAAVKKNESVILDDFLNPDTYQTGAYFKNAITLNIFPKEGYHDAVLANLTKIPNIHVFKKGSQELKDLHYNDNERIGPIVIVGEEGVIIVKNKTAKEGFKHLGMHGYLPNVKNMRPFFLATGPAFKKGYIAEAFRNVDVYPLMCHILGIKPAPNNGSLDAVISMLIEDDVKEKTFTLTAVSFLLLVGLSVTIAGIFSICACRNAKRKTRFLLPWKKRIRTETGFKILSSSEGELLGMNDDDDEF